MLRHDVMLIFCQDFMDKQKCPDVKHEIRIKTPMGKQSVCAVHKFVWSVPQP